MASYTSATKRQKEIARKQRQQEKAARKQQRQQENLQRRASADPGEDPDLAGITLGPQPPQED
jgi:hypothetical protein